MDNEKSRIIKNSSNNYTQECIFLHDKESKKTQQAKHVDPLQFCLIHQNQSPVQISHIKHCTAIVITTLL